jgi:hypothetical protein
MQAVGPIGLPAVVAGLSTLLVCFIALRTMRRARP